MILDQLLSGVGFVMKIVFFFNQFFSTVGNVFGADQKPTIAPTVA